MKELITVIEVIDDKRMAVYKYWNGTSWRYKAVPEKPFRWFWPLSYKWSANNWEKSGALTFEVPVFSSAKSAIERAEQIKKEYLGGATPLPPKEP